MFELMFLVDREDSCRNGYEFAANGVVKSQEIDDEKPRMRKKKLAPNSTGTNATRHLHHL
jgi:hypothetical protein